MSRPRAGLHYLLVIVGALLISSARGHGQGPAPARTVLNVGLPAVDRGLAVTEPRAPGSALPTVRRATVEGRQLDRVDASGTSYLPGRVIVKFRGGVSSVSRLNSLSAVSSSAVMAPRPEYADFDIVNIDPGEDAEAVARAFSLRDDVEYAQADYRVWPYFVPNDSFYRQVQWNFPQVDLERAWDIEGCPQGSGCGGTSSVIVAVLDSGVAFQDVNIPLRAVAFSSGGFSYPALGTILVPFSRAPDLATSADRFVLPHDFIWGDNQPVDMDGHGTHVAGTIGQLTNNNSGVAGIASNVRIMPIKVISAEWDDIFRSPNTGTDDIVAQGIRYAADNGAKVLNMSIGRGGAPAPVVEAAINYAVNKGCFVAIAGGNEFETGNSFEALADIAQRVKGAIAVGAVDRSQHRAFYSSTGPYVEIAAPGGSIRSFGTDGLVYQQTYDPDFTDTFKLSPSQYKAPRFDMMAIVGFQGTSMATPHVAGLAALLMSQGLTDPAAIEAAMERFAIDLGAPGRDNEFGFGEINARNTLRGLGLAR